MTDLGPQQSQPVPELAAQPPQPPLKRSVWRRPLTWVLAGAGVAGVAVVVVAVVVVITPKPFTTEGTYDVVNNADLVINSDGSGSSGAGFVDIREGAEVTVVDSHKNILAIGTLGTGTALPDGATCEYSFAIEDVPAGIKFYGVECGTSKRGVLLFTEKQMRAGIALTIGS